MPGLVERVGSAAAAEIEKFKAAAAEFSTQYQWLKENRPPMVVAPGIMREYETLLSRSRIAGETMRRATQAIDAAVGAVWRTTGYDPGGALGGLAGPWLIPIAIVSGATAALVSIARTIRVYRERMAVFTQLRSQGVEPAAAWTRARAAVQDTGLIQSLGQYGVIIAALAAAGFYFYSRR